MTEPNSTPGFARSRLQTVLGWSLAAAAAFWVAGSVGRILLSAASHTQFALLLGVLGPARPSWHVTAAEWISWIIAIGELAAKGLLGLLLALGLRDAARRYGRRGDPSPSTTPAGSAR